MISQIKFTGIKWISISHKVSDGEEMGVILVHSNEGSCEIRLCDVEKERLIQSCCNFLGVYNYEINAPRKRRLK